MSAKTDRTSICRIRLRHGSTITLVICFQSIYLSSSLITLLRETFRFPVSLTEMFKWSLHNYDFYRHYLHIRPPEFQKCTLQLSIIFPLSGFFCYINYVMFSFSPLIINLECTFILRGWWVRADGEGDSSYDICSSKHVPSFEGRNTV